MTRMRPGLVSRAAQLDSASGDWGRLDVTPASIAQHKGRAILKLTLYPPGTDREQRFWLGVRALGSTYPGVAALLAALVVGMGLGGWLGAVVALVVVAAFWKFAAVRTAQTSRDSHTIVAVIGATGEMSRSARELHHLLTQLDELNARPCDPVEREALLWTIYDRMSGDTL